VVDLEKIRELVALMVEHELSEVDLRDGEERVLIKRGGAQALPTVIAPGHVAPHAAPAVTNSAPGARPPSERDTAADWAAEGLIAITSPMVGTFYSAADPESAPYVAVGGRVEAGNVVCIIEAMKVFNEIKAEVSGTVEQVLVRNEQAVEYGQPLFLVRP
jgi:acetyl-CoA carboxylase biotin carboxyl carrier protein